MCTAVEKYTISSWRALKLIYAQKHQETREESPRLVKDDLNKFSTRLCLAKLRNNDSINIKQMVYRSSTLFIGAMGRFHNIPLNSCFDIVKKMAGQNNITPQTKHSLLFAVAIACEVRLRVYMGHKSQHDLIDIKADKGGIKNFLNVAGQANTMRYFQVVYWPKQKSNLTSEWCPAETTWLCWQTRLWHFSSFFFFFFFLNRIPLPRTPRKVGKGKPKRRPSFISSLLRSFPIYLS